MSQVNYYVRGGQVKEERGTQEQQEVQGSRLFIGEQACGGRWLEVGTDPRESQMVTMVQFRASKQLHFVDTHRHARRSMVGDHGTDSTTLVRSIPFDNKDICQRILKRDGKTRGIRMAPLHPRRRGVLRCDMCGYMYGCPSYDANAWLEHLGASIQKVLGRGGALNV